MHTHPTTQHAFTETLATSTPTSFSSKITFYSTNNTPKFMQTRASYDETTYLMVAQSKDDQKSNFTQMYNYPTSMYHWVKNVIL